MKPINDWALAFPARCPGCGFTESDESWLDGDFDDFDCLGCCEGQIICPRCATEFNPETGLVHQVCEECQKKLAGILQNDETQKTLFGED